MPIVTPNTPTKRLQLSIDYRAIILVLLAVIAGMLIIWKPWNQTTDNSDRTIKVTGETTVKAEPDEFVFYPSYQFKNADKTAALADVTKKSDEITTKLKQLGVADNQIKTNTNGYENYSYFRNDDNTFTYSFQLTVTVNAKDLAQKVQDYLVTTTPSASVSPQANFSEAKRKQLESTARDQATKDARAKADQSAKNLGFKVGKVKSVEDGTGFDRIYPLNGEATDTTKLASPTQLTIQPGQNDITYSVTVTYFVK